MDQMTPFDSVKYQSFNKKKKKKNVILLKKRKRTNTYVYIMKINLFNATIYGACEGCGLLNCKWDKLYIEVNQTFQSVVMMKPLVNPIEDLWQNKSYMKIINMNTYKNKPPTSIRKGGVKEK